MSAALFFAVWTLIALVVGLVIGVVIRFADRKQAEALEAPADDAEVAP